MAAYESPFYTKGSYDDRRNQDVSPSPIPSPYDERPSPYTQASYKPPYYRADSQDPFADDDAVPLRNYGSKFESQSSVAPIIQPEYEDPFVRDAQPGKSQRPTRNLPIQGGWFTGKITWVCYILTVVQLGVFMGEIAKNIILTKSPIEIHPTFNPMIGPSPYVLINMGARYQPCMHNMENVTNNAYSISWPCPNATSTTDATCSLSELCGFNGVPNPHAGGSMSDRPEPNQWWRFIVPIFLHAGIVHIGFNLLLQLTLGRDMERKIGSIRFTFIYFASGIFGFVLGGNFAADGIASTGCSGSLFGILALDLLDLLYWWHERPSPKKDLGFMLVDVVVSFALGLLPGLDNFSHIGGFLTGLVLGICVLRSPPAFHADVAVYGAEGRMTSESKTPGYRQFTQGPLLFFRGRKRVWWIWWFVRVFSLFGIGLGFILLLKNFYVWQHGCSWCKYLSCLPVKDWCDLGVLDFSSSSSSKRDLLALTKEVFEPTSKAAL